jgi:hypothetical protein
MWVDKNACSHQHRTQQNNFLNFNFKLHFEREDMKGYVWEKKKE